MKKYILPIIVLLFANVSYAQFRIGIKGGYDIISHKINSDILNANNRLGFQVGLTAELLSIAGLGVETAVLYSHKEYKIEEKTTNSSLTDYDYISIPINLKKRFDITDLFGVFGVAGVFGDVRINGNNIEYLGEQYKTKNFAMGLNLGFGLKLLKDFDLGLYYKHTLTENFKTDKPELSDLKNKKQKDWTVSLSYYF